MCSSATSFTTHLTRGHPRANPGLRGDKQRPIAQPSRYKYLRTVIFLELMSMSVATLIAELHLHGWQVGPVDDQMVPSVSRRFALCRSYKCVLRIYRASFQNCDHSDGWTTPPYRTAVRMHH
jgi:hypothetical protein